MMLTNVKKHIPQAVAIATGVLLIGCTNTSLTDALENTINQKDTRLQELEMSLKESKAQLANLSATNQSPVIDETLLPPDAKSGECYARVWMEPTYRQVEKNLLVKSASQKIETSPAQYKTVSERILVSEASSKVIPVPAVYKNSSERILVEDSTRAWHIEPYNSSPRASDEILQAAKRHGINLDTAKAGMCFHEHYIAPTYGNVAEKVLVSEASQKVVSTKAQYRTVEKRVLVKDESTRLINVPAVYETVTEKVLDKPAHQVWKKGTGAIQRIEESTGEIMCLVDIPASYKTITKRVLKSAATTRSEVVPAQYKTVKVRELAKAAGEQRTSIPAKYSTVNKKKVTKEGYYVWHEVHDNTLSKRSRTHNKICLVETAAKYKTVKKRIVATAAGVKTMEIPAVYKNVEVRKLVTAAKVKKTPIAAEYRTVTHNVLDKEGRMEWRSILCETNMTRSRIGDIQRALKSKGFNPGRIDGVIGRDTIKAVNGFQRANKLPVDKYLNIETVKALGVSPR